MVQYVFNYTHISWENLENALSLAAVPLYIMHTDPNYLDDLVYREESELNHCNTAIQQGT